MSSSSCRLACCYQVECLECIKNYNSEYQFTHFDKSHDNKKGKFVRATDSQQSALQTFFQKETRTKENAGSIINVNNTNSMTKPNSSNNPLVYSTGPETEIPYVS